MPQKDPLGNDASRTWWGMNTYDFILVRTAPSISPKPIVNLRGTNSQVGEAAETKCFSAKVDFLGGIPY